MRPATARSPRRSGPVSAPGRGSTRAAATWSSARRQIRDIIPRHRQDGVYIFEAALLHDLARLGSPHEAVDRLGGTRRLHRRSVGGDPRQPRACARRARHRQAARRDRALRGRSTCSCSPPRRPPSSPTCTGRGPSRAWRPLPSSVRWTSPQRAGGLHTPALAARIAGSSRSPGTGTRGRAAGRHRPQQQGDRRSARSVDAHRRHASRPRVPQAGHCRPVRAGRGARRRQRRDYVDPPPAEIVGDYVVAPDVAPREMAHDRSTGTPPRHGSRRHPCTRHLNTCHPADRGHMPNGATTAASSGTATTPSRSRCSGASE